MLDFGPLIAALRRRAGHLDPAHLPAQLQELCDHAADSRLPAELLAEFSEQLADAQALAAIQAEHGLGLPGNPAYQAPTQPPNFVDAAARPLPQIQIPFFPRSPQIDGRADEAAWQQAAQIPALWWSTGSNRPQVRTHLQLGYDAQAIYLAWHNQEPRPDRLSASQIISPELANDDTVELFLSPERDLSKYYYFVLNAANARFAKASFDAAWHGEWQAASRRSAEGWQAEIRIPFASLRVPVPQRGGIWHGNFCRRRPQEIVPYHCWSMTFGGIHRSDRFGRLEFAAKPGSESVN
jgi:hypothetical protein